jgi:hypothetical protein
MDKETALRALVNSTCNVLDMASVVEREVVERDDVTTCEISCRCVLQYWTRAENRFIARPDPSIRARAFERQRPPRVLENAICICLSHARVS